MAIVIPKPVPKGGEVTPKSDKKAREGRSPAFPFIDLKTALERAEQFRVAEGKHLVPVSSAMKAWSLGEKTSAGRRTVAALGHFGLFEEEGAADARKVRLSEVALNILLDKQPESGERDGLIRMLALTPPIHMELWEKWKAELPSDTTIETYLVRDRGFSSQGALDFLTEYKNTLAFANLVQSGNMGTENAESEVPRMQVQHPPKPGVIPPPPPLKPAMLQEVFNLDEGPVTLAYPSALSSESYEELKAALELFLRRARRRALLHEAFDDPEYRAKREAEIKRRASAKNDEAAN